MTVLLVGCGNMGFAMMTGWLAADQPPEVWVVEPAEPLRSRAETAGAKGVAAPEELPADLAPTLVILAVKPQIMAEVAPAYARFDAATFLSIAAGTPISALRAATNGPVIRCMPNTPAAIGAGMMVCCATEDVSDAARENATKLLAASGDVAWIEDEDLMDAVTAISGSGPAYVFHMIEALTNAATALDLPPDIARRLALQTVAGAGAYAAGSDTPPDQLRIAVTSPGGTTAAALDVLMAEDGLSQLLARATEAARDRGRALGKG